MANPVLIKTFEDLSKQIDTLIEDNTDLRKKLKSLELRNQQLEALHDEDQKRIEKANQNIEFLSMSHRLADSPEALIAARTKIAQLIRTIDSCIRLIKED